MLVLKDKSKNLKGGNTMDELRERAIRNMQKDLDTAYKARDYGDEELYRLYRKRYYTKVELYEAMFEGELVYNIDGKVTVEEEECE